MTDSNFSRHFMATDFPLCFNVELFEDSLFEGNETFNLSLQTVNSFITLNPSSALFTIYNTVSPYSLINEIDIYHLFTQGVIWILRVF